MTGTVELIGWFRDLPHGISTAPPIEEVRDQLTDAQATLIVQYLDKGEVVAETLGTLTIDVLAASHRVIGPLQTMTDGLLVWPSDLPYYVMSYCVGLPTSALARMASFGWQCPTVSGDVLDAVIDRLSELSPG